MPDVFDKIDDPVAAAQALGPALFKSNLMQLSTADAGIMVMFECFARKITPQSFAETYHVMKGKMTKKSDAMLAEFERRGGKYTIVERSPEVCQIEFQKDGRKYLSTCTHEEIKQESFYTHYKDGKPKINDNYATPRRRMQALSARCVSDGVRVVDPTVCAGLYTPEETVDMEIEDAEPQKSPARKKAQQVTQQAVTESVEETQAEQAQPGESVTNESPLAGNATTEPQKDIATKPQVAMLLSHLESAYGVDADSKLQAALAKRGVEHVEELSRADADELIMKLEQIIARNAEKNALAAHS